MTSIDMSIIVLFKDSSTLQLYSLTRAFSHKIEALYEVTSIRERR